MLELPLSSQGLVSYLAPVEIRAEDHEMAADLEEFESFDDGNYFALYNQNRVGAGRLLPEVALMPVICPQGVSTW